MEHTDGAVAAECYVDDDADGTDPISKLSKSQVKTKTHSTPVKNDAVVEDAMAAVVQ